MIYNNIKHLLILLFIFTTLPATLAFAKNYTLVLMTAGPYYEEEHQSNNLDAQDSVRRSKTKII